MNREQAERILDAYLSTCYAVDADGIYPDTESEKTRDALREVILDAMTEYRSKPTTWINKQLKMANALLRKSEAAKIKRIEELEELVRDLHADLMEYGCTPNAHRANYKPRFEALGIEVSE